MNPQTDINTGAPGSPPINSGGAPDEPNGDPRKLAEKWAKEIDAAERELKPFHEASRKVLQRYLDKRQSIGGVVSDLGSDGIFRQNLFWSTVQVMLSNLYAKRPKVDVSRAHKDFGDDAARVAGTIIERILNNDIEKDNCDFDIAVRNGIEDNLIVGLGQMWLIYEVETQKMTVDPMTGQPMPAPEGTPGAEQEYESSPPHADIDAGMEPGDVDSPLSAMPQPLPTFEQITSEAVLADYVHWSDFLYSPARTWEEVRWVARKVRMTKEQLITRFGPEVAERIPLTIEKTDKGMVRVQNDPFPKGTVFEVWCRESSSVYWYAKGVPVILDAEADPLHLEGFFPCPKPLMANLTTSALMPVADYHFAQDQYELIDEMTTRAAWLTRAIKAVGVYDKTNDGLKRVFSEAYENQMIPVDNWAAFAEKGGVKGAMDFAPVEQYATALRNLNQEIPLAKQALFEVLGIGDIMRGMTDPNETASAQQLKAKFGSTRLELRQWQIANWAAEASRIKAEIMVRHFQPQTLVMQSGIENTPDAPLVPQAMDLLKGDPDQLPYRISIEPDSMAAVDYAEMREARTQYLSSMGGFVQALTPLLQVKPEVAPFMLEMLRWGMVGFKGGKQIESVLDEAIRAAQQPAPPAPPNPEQQAKVAKDSTQAEKNTADAQKTKVETILLPMQAQAQADAEMANAQRTGLPPLNGGLPQ
jgi:hypothetical protein